jgi:hypothetical protein
VLHLGCRCALRAGWGWGRQRRCAAGKQNVGAMCSFFVSSGDQPVDLCCARCATVPQQHAASQGKATCKMSDMQQRQQERRQVTGGKARGDRYWTVKPCPHNATSSSLLGYALFDLLYTAH